MAKGVGGWDPCPFRWGKMEQGYWALRLYDACGFVCRPCCDSMKVGCLCEWCWALVRLGEARKLVEYCEWYVEAVQADSKRQEEIEQRGYVVSELRRRRW